MDRLEEMPISHGIQEMIVILHDTNRAFLSTYSRPKRLSKSYWPYFQSAPVERDRFVSHLYQAQVR